MPRSFTHSLSLRATRSATIPLSHRASLPGHQGSYRLGQIRELEYIARIGWVKPLLSAVRANRRLEHLVLRWRQHRLSDLAFAIDTRLNYLPNLTERIDEPMRRVVASLSESSQPLAEYLRRRLALRITDRKALSDVLIAASSFMSESRALFENLAEFYREFTKECFGQASIGTKASYEAMARMTRRRGWATALQTKRHDILHRRSLWLAFDIDLDRQPLFEPIFLLNWRPGSHRLKDTIRRETVLEIRQRLPEAAHTMRDRLIKRVKAV
jgi:hypothetical protein